MSTMSRMIVTVFSLFAASQALAAQPNLYTCTNDQEGISVTYSPTSMIGTPQFSISVNGEAALTQEQNLLETSDMALGKVISVTVVHHIPDAGAKVYSLIIPTIGDLLREPTVAFKGVLLQGYKGGFIAPAYSDRINTVTELTCKAEAVFF